MGVGRGAIPRSCRSPEAPIHAVLSTRNKRNRRMASVLLKGCNRHLEKQLPWSCVQRLQRRMGGKDLSENPRHNENKEDAMKKKHAARKIRKTNRRGAIKKKMTDLLGRKIPVGGGLPISLKKTTPDPMTPDALRAELEAMGLACDQITDDSLNQYIAEVRDNLPKGKVQTFRITKASHAAYEATENGNWDVVDAAEMSYWGPILATIVEKNNFDLLTAANLQPPFCGVEVEEVSYDDTPTEEAVMLAFVDIATAASAGLVEGLDEADMEAALTNVIKAQDIELDDYYYADDRLFYLMEDYDPTAEEAGGLGAETIDWTISVEDYRNKSKDDPDNQSIINVACRTVLYGEGATILRDYQYVMNQAKAHPRMTKATDRGIPVPSTPELKVYDDLPAPNLDTFIHSMPAVEHSDYQDVTVLYLPELVNVACLDNTQSAASSDFSVTLSVGFTNTNSVSFGFGASMGVGIDFLNTEFHYDAELSVTNQYAVTAEEKARTVVPAGEKAFIYQGRILTKTLRYHAGNQTYEYTNTDDGEFLTKVYVTSRTQQVAEPAPTP